MAHLNKPILSYLLILLLFPHSISHAQSNGLSEDNQPQAEIQQLQTQIMNANSKIAVLETSLNAVNQDIKALRNSEALNVNTRLQENTRRMANGHGR